MDGGTRGLGSRVGDGWRTPTRRLLLVGAGAAALAVLVDRGLRLDVPQPTPPVPTRRPAPDEALLLSAVAGLDRVVRAETAVLATDDGDGLVRRLRSVNREQLSVLRGRLTNAGVPTTVIDAALAARAATPVRTREALAALLDSLGPRDWTALSAATPDTRELLAGAYAQRLAGAVLLGRDVATPPTSPVRPAVVARTQPLVYAFEVVAAQSTGARRRTAEATLAELVRLEQAVTGPGTAPPAGWALPFPVTNPQAARRLAASTLSAAVRSGPELAGAAPTAASLEDVARWSAHVQALAVDWDVPLTAFPGATA